jgi:hypothetical protein
MDELLEFYELAMRVHRQRGYGRRRAALELEQA